MAKQITLLLLILLITARITGQQQLGINTSTPVRTLDVFGSSDQYIRVHSSTALTGIAGLELFRGTNDVVSKDWKFYNDGILKFYNSDDNFATSEEVMRINASYNTGIGSTSPNSKLHIEGGSLIAFGGHGYLKIGTLGGQNLAFDNAQIMALNNGNPSPLYFQANGGDTYFNLGGGNTLMAIGGGSVGVGTTTPTAPLSIVDDGFQFYIDNDADDPNSWYIGASNDAWQTGDNQLVFSPTSSSGDAVLRLMNTTENDGTNAPVMIHSTTDQTILLDGNEIDTRGTSLYINHNSDEETYINPTGGRVGIGTTNPQAMLHVNASSGFVMTLQKDNVSRWHISPAIGGNENLNFYWDDYDSPFAQVHGATGQWMHLSDINFKENIIPLPDVMDKLKDLKIYSYSFKHDPNHREMIGVIAQEAELLFPEMVKVNQGQYGVAYSQLAAVGIKAIKEQQQLIGTLKNKINQLKTEIATETQDEQIVPGN